MRGLRCAPRWGKVTKRREARFSHTASSTAPNSSNFCRKVISSVCHARPLRYQCQRTTVAEPEPDPGPNLLGGGREMRFSPDEKFGHGARSRLGVPLSMTRMRENDKGMDDQQQVARIHESSNDGDSQGIRYPKQVEKMEGKEIPKMGTQDDRRAMQASEQAGGPGEAANYHLW